MGPEWVLGLRLDLNLNPHPEQMTYLFLFFIFFEQQHICNLGLKIGYT